MLQAEVRIRRNEQASRSIQAPFVDARVAVEFKSGATLEATTSPVNPRASGAMLAACGGAGGYYSFHWGATSVGSVGSATAGRPAPPTGVTPEPSSSGARPTRSRSIQGG